MQVANLTEDQVSSLKDQGYSTDDLSLLTDEEVKILLDDEGEDDSDDAPSRPKKTYGVQLALYTDLLSRLGVSAGGYGYIWDVYGAEVRYDLTAPLGPRSPSLWEVI